MPLLLMEADGATNCSQKLLHIACPICIFFAKLLQFVTFKHLNRSHYNGPETVCRCQSFTVLI